MNRPKAKSFVGVVLNETVFISVLVLSMWTFIINFGMHSISY